MGLILCESFSDLFKILGIGNRKWENKPENQRVHI